MKQYEYYTEQVKRLPGEGQRVIASVENDHIIVYQAFNPRIAAYAVQHQQFGGPDYSFNRMSWIKPGFLWMMYRSGWAGKPNQEKVLAITIPLVHFKTILSESTFTSFDNDDTSAKEKWKEQLSETEVRLQWDPDHDPYGVKQQRKAIQLGMKGAILKKFATEWITHIEDVTPFVKEQYLCVQQNNLAQLRIPYEEVITIDDERLIKRCGITI